MITHLALLACALSVFTFINGIPVRSEGAERTFYQGKTLTIVINFAGGGPTDVEGRVIAKHLGKHIPGQRY